MQPPGTRDPDATRTAIIKAAEEIFLDHGYGGSSISTIARRAQVTKSLIHHHFGSKKELWKEVKFQRLSRYTDQQMTMLKGGEPRPELLRQSIETYFRFLQQNPQFVRMLSWINLEGDQLDSAVAHRELIEEGTKMLRQGQESGQLRKDLDPRMILFVFLGLGQHWFRARDNFFRPNFEEKMTNSDLDEQYLENMLKMFFEGVLPRT